MCYPVEDLDEEGHDSSAESEESFHSLSLSSSSAYDSAEEDDDEDDDDDEGEERSPKRRNEQDSGRKAKENEKNASKEEEEGEEKKVDLLKLKLDPISDRSRYFSLLEEPCWTIVVPLLCFSLSSPLSESSLITLSRFCIGLHDQHDS